MLDELKDLEAPAWLDTHLFNIKDTAVTIGSVVTFVVICIAAILISFLVRRAIARAFAVRGVKDEGTVAVTTRLTHYVILIVGFGIAMNTIGIDLTALFAAGAVFAVGLGFAMQTIAQNFVSGVILLIERSITPGDIIEIDGKIVRVTKMSIRTTHARTLDDEELIMPNSHLVQSVVKNYTLQDTLYRVSCDVGVSYDSDMDQVHRVIMETLVAVDWRVKSRDPVCRINAFGSSSVDFKAFVWVDDPWGAETLRGRLYKQIWDRLKQEGITIAYPQLDLHLDSDVAKRIGRGETQAD